MRLNLLALLSLSALLAACSSSGSTELDGATAADAVIHDATANLDAQAASDALVNPDAAPIADATPIADAAPSGDAAPTADAAPSGDAASTDAASSADSGAITVTSTVDLSATALTAGRTCAEASAHAVAALGPTHATVTATPAAGCLAAGDEVLLINLQGTPTSTRNVGNWELLQVAQISGPTIHFASAKVRTYGAAPGSDQGIGSGAVDQKVALIRVPQLGNLTVAAGAVLSAAQFDGSTGGVLVLRADALTLEGVISAAQLGYRGGDWSKSDQFCSDNLTTQAGESISGPGTPSTANNLGGAGGISALSGVSFNGNTPVSATPGHARAGEPGFNPVGRVLGQPGVAYGINDGTRLTMGSGPGGNLTCDTNTTTPTYVPSLYWAGGIVLLLVGDLTVGDSGRITSTPIEAGRDVAAAGGYVFIRGTSASVGNGRISALGAVGHSGTAALAGQSNRASEGYVVIDTSGTLTGSTTPPARHLTH